MKKIPLSTSVGQSSSQSTGQTLKWPNKSLPESPSSAISLKRSESSCFNQHQDFCLATKSTRLSFVAADGGDALAEGRDGEDGDYGKGRTQKRSPQTLLLSGIVCGAL